MAAWYFKILIWYGFVIQFQQIDCIRHSWGRTSQEDEILASYKKHRIPNRNIQGDKRILTQRSEETSKEKIFGIRKVANHRRNSRETDAVGKTKHSKLSQVPDDDFDDEGIVQFNEITENINMTVNLYQSRRFFYRNDEKVLIPFQPNSSFQLGGEMHPLQTQSEQTKDVVRALLYEEDALEEPYDDGPLFENRVIWVNMLRSQRGWTLNRKKNIARTI